MTNDQINMDKYCLPTIRELIDQGHLVNCQMVIPKSKLILPDPDLPRLRKRRPIIKLFTRSD